MGEKEAVEADLQAAVVDGLAEVKSRPDGQDGFSLTKKGVEHVEALLRAAGYDPDTMTNHDFADFMGAPPDAPIRQEPVRRIKQIKEGSS